MKVDKKKIKNYSSNADSHNSKYIISSIKRFFLAPQNIFMCDELELEQSKAKLWYCKAWQHHQHLLSPNPKEVVLVQVKQCFGSFACIKKMVLTF